MRTIHRRTLPDQLVQRLTQLYPQHVGDVMKGLDSQRLTTFRVNTLATTTTQLVELLMTQGVVVASLPWYRGAFVLKNDTRSALFQSQENQDGLFYVQGLSSMIPPLVLSPKPGETILDLAASPGSKTTQMAAMMENTGTIVANDISPSRIFKLKRNLTAQGVTNVTILSMPGSVLWRKFPEYFDRTLVDAPCSMEGRVHVEDPRTYRNWSIKKIKQLSKRQRWLLRSAVSATKPGGVVVYSTCTLAPEENEAVIDWLIAKEGDAVEIEEIHIRNLKTVAGIKKWQGVQYNPQVQRAARILPSQLMEGFFVAKIRKLASTVGGSPIGDRGFSINTGTQ